jgi:rubredoxin
MSTIEVPAYLIECDRCGKIFEDVFSMWPDRNIAEEKAANSGWESIEDKYYCPACFVVDEKTDEIIIKEQ